MAQEWTEGRLDELSGKVDRGFEHAAAEARALRLEMRTEFTAVRAEMKEGFARIDGRLDGIQRAMIYMMVSVTGGMLAGFSAILVLIATQL